MTDYPPGIAASLLVHIVAGSLGLATGYVALFSPKGAVLHRGSGRIFVYAMTTMGLTGALIAALGATEISVFAGVVTAYLAITAFTAVRPRTPRVERLDRSLAAVALLIGVASLALGVHTLASPTGTRDGLPAFPFFIMGLPALLGGLGDVRTLRRGVRQGRARLVRHLWRMCYALLIAAMSFFFGQADELPAMLRAPALLAAPVVAVLLSMLYWLWRLRARGMPLTAGRVAGKVRHEREARGTGHHQGARERRRHLDRGGLRQPSPGAGNPHELP